MIWFVFGGAAVLLWACLGWVSSVFRNIKGVADAKTDAEKIGGCLGAVLNFAGWVFLIGYMISVIVYFAGK
jgi:hypothetical protein